MGFDEFHMYMRFVQMEFAGFKEDAGKPPPTFITSVLEDESLVDRLVKVFTHNSHYGIRLWLGLALK